jgi:hypothetical protein
MKTVKPKLSYKQGDPQRKLPDVQMVKDVNEDLEDHMADYAVKAGLAVHVYETKVVEFESKEDGVPKLTTKKAKKSSRKNK